MGRPTAVPFAGVDGEGGTVDRTSIDLTGKNFDPGNQAHVDTVLRKVEENHGPGWEIQDFADGVLTLVRRGLIHRVEGTGTTRTVSLGGIMRATDGEKAAQMLESDPKNAGWYLTGFQPHINRGILSKLTDAEVRCRSAVATALGVKPWDVQVSARDGGGFRLGLPPQYVPSKHDDKLAEVAEITVGELGWYFVGNSNALTGEIIPSTPPMFPASIPYPLDRMPHPQDGALRPIPIGERLADRGDEPNETLYLNFSAAPHAQLGGITGAGKSVTLNDIISGALAGGAELAIIDVPQKAVDFENWRPFVRKGGWGCESLEEGAVVLEQLYREGERRATVLKRYKAKNVNELPADIRATMRDVVIIIDEVTGLFAPETVPRRLSGKDPLRVEAENRNYAKELIKTFVQKIAAEQRFVGFHLILSTQVASTDTGISTSLRTNLPHKMLLGAVATAGNRKLILANVSAAPEIPDRVKQDEDVAKGVGIAEFAGQPTVVFKSYYATEETLIEALRQRGIHPLPETQLDQTRPAHAAVRARFPDLAQQASDAREAATPQYGTGSRVYELSSPGFVRG